MGLVTLGGLVGVMMFWASREEQPVYVWNVVSRSATFLSANRLAIADDQRTIIVSFPTYQLIRELPAGGYLAASPDGLLLTVGAWGTVHLFDPERGDRIGTLDCWSHGENLYPIHLSFSPNGYILAVAESHHNRDPVVQLWDVVRQMQIGTVRIDEPDATVVKALAFSPDGRLVVSTYSEGVWLVNTAQQTVVRKIQSWPNEYIALKRDGSRVSLGEIALVRTFDTNTWQVMHEQHFDQQSKPSGPISRLFSMPVAISPDGKWLATPNRMPPRDSF
ncbi:WD40 repeat domain-containing protein [Chloroflexus sp.]|uniref:WD40 repeat domain-containing protein n=1 Tax=Chloroflexus sp. TaxID=1904827 RepID=UPI003C783CE7